MNQREAKQRACALCGSLLRHLRDSGWPYAMQDDGLTELDGILLENAEGKLTANARRLEKAFDELEEELLRRGHSQHD